MADMNIWLAAGIAMLLTLIPCVVVMLHARRLTDCMVALQLAGVVAVLALMILAQAMHRPSFYDLALALALLSFPSALMFAHFLEVWLR